MKTLNIIEATTNKAGTGVKLKSLRTNDVLWLDLPQHNNLEMVSVFYFTRDYLFNHGFNIIGYCHTKAGHNFIEESNNNKSNCDFKELN